MRSRPLGVVAGLGAGLAAGCVLGALQAMVLHELRGPVTALLATGAVALGAGWCTGLGLRAFHVRDLATTVAVAVVVGLGAEAASLWTFAHLVVGAPLGDLDPATVLAVLGRALGEGTWRWTHYRVAGPVLAAVWLAEAAAVVGGAALFAWGAVTARPYCEACGGWCRGPVRVGPLTLPPAWPRTGATDPDDEDDDDEGDPEEEPLPERWDEGDLGRLVARTDPGWPRLQAELWRCGCATRARVTLLLARPGGGTTRLLDRQPISRATADLLVSRQQRPAGPAPGDLAPPPRGRVRARVPDERSRWTRPCSLCGLRLATGLWDHVNGFTVVCPHCGGLHSRHPAVEYLLLAATLTGPLAFFLVMRPLRALRAGLVVAALLWAGRLGLGDHPSLLLESSLYVLLLLACVVTCAAASGEQKADLFAAR